MAAALVVDPHADVRIAAFAGLTALVQTHGRVLNWSRISSGFQFQGKNHLWANKVVGIFKPAVMRIGALSIKTTVPRTGREARYADLERPGEAFRYDLQGNDPDNSYNRSLREAFQLQAPLIYFFGLAPNQYEPIFPVRIASIDLAAMSCEVVPIAEYFIEPGNFPMAAENLGEIEKRYSLGFVKRRLHQDAFRIRVLEAYEHRCSICGLPSDELLQAAHIRPDAEVLGLPTVNNGLALCHLHHSVFDQHLLGIRPDLTIKLAKSLLSAHDGPTLEHALKFFHDKSVKPPKRDDSKPAEGHLTWRYEQFLRKAG